MREFAVHTLDVFTDRVFGGNPLAVLPDARGISDADMQRIARETNLSETVFVLPPEGAGDARVRIFTPGREVPFAGHPTVGTAVFLADAGLVDVPSDGTRTIVLEENVGPVAVDVRIENGRGVHGRLTAAVAPEEIAFDGSLAECAAMIGRPVADLEVRADGDGWNSLGGLLRDPSPCWASAGLEFFVVPVRDRAACAASRLDSETWRRVLPAGSPSTMVYVVAPGDGDTDLHVRMYAPDIGVPEDPATGSACAALGGWLGARLDPGVYEWSVAQGIEMGRPSRLDLEVRVGPDGVEAIRVGGAAVRVLDGTMRVP